MEIDNTRTRAKLAISHHFVTRRWEQPPQKKQKQKKRQIAAYKNDRYIRYIKCRLLYFEATKLLLKELKLKRKMHITQTLAIPSWSSHERPFC